MPKNCLEGLESYVDSLTKKGLRIIAFKSEKIVLYQIQKQGKGQNVEVVSDPLNCKELRAFIKGYFILKKLMENK